MPCVLDAEWCCFFVRPVGHAERLSVRERGDDGGLEMGRREIYSGIRAYPQRLSHSPLAICISIGTCHARLSKRCDTLPVTYRQKYEQTAFIHLGRRPLLHRHVRFLNCPASHTLSSCSHDEPLFHTASFRQCPFSLVCRHPRPCSPCPPRSCVVLPMARMRTGTRLPGSGA